MTRIVISEEQTIPQERKVTPKATLNTEELKVVEKRQLEDKHVNLNYKIEAKSDNLQSITDETFILPTNSVQFTSRWYALQKSDLKYEFLRRIAPNTIPKIFVDTLDSRLFSDIVCVLSENMEKEHTVLKYLICFTHVKRFSTLAMFMSTKDKNCVKQILEHAKVFESVDEETMNYLLAQYKL